MVAIGVSVGVSVDEVPAPMLRACDRHALPLFTAPYDILFIAVSQQVAHPVLEGRFPTLNATVDVHRQVFATVVGGGGVAGVLATVARSMRRGALIAQDFSGAELQRLRELGIEVQLID